MACIRVAGGGAGSIDFWVPHPRGCGWCVHVPLFATHTHTHTPFPLAPVRYYVMRSKSYHFSYHAIVRPLVLPVFSLIFLRLPVIVAKVIILIEDRGGGGVTGALAAWAIPLISRIIPMLRRTGWIVFGAPPLSRCHWLENKLAVSEREREKEDARPAGTIDLEMKTPRLEYLVWLVLVPPRVVHHFYCSSSGYFPRGWRFYWQNFSPALGRK